MKLKLQSYSGKNLIILLPRNLKHNSLKKSRSPTDKTTHKKTVYRNLEIHQHYQENWSTRCKENTRSLNGKLTTKRAPREINKKQNWSINWIQNLQISTQNPKWQLHNFFNIQFSLKKSRFHKQVPSTVVLPANRNNEDC